MPVPARSRVHRPAEPTLKGSASVWTDVRVRESGRRSDLLRCVHLFPASDKGLKVLRRRPITWVRRPGPHCLLKNAHPPRGGVAKPWISLRSPVFERSAPLAPCAAVTADIGLRLDRRAAGDRHLGARHRDRPCRRPRRHAAIDSDARIANYGYTAGHEQVVILQAWETAELRRLKRANPGVKVLMYQNALSASTSAAYDGLYPTGVSSARHRPQLAARRHQRPAVHLRGRGLALRGRYRLPRLSAGMGRERRAGALARSLERRLHRRPEPHDPLSRLRQLRGQVPDRRALRGRHGPLRPFRGPPCPGRRKARRREHRLLGRLSAPRQPLAALAQRRDGRGVRQGRQRPAHRLHERGDLARAAARGARHPVRAQDLHRHHPFQRRRPPRRPVRVCDRDARRVGRRDLRDERQLQHHDVVRPLRLPHRDADRPLPDRSRRGLRPLVHRWAGAGQPDDPRRIRCPGRPLLGLRAARRAPRHSAPPDRPGPDRVQPRRAATARS